MTILGTFLFLLAASPQAAAHADLRLSQSFFCDPNCGYIASARVENLGPDRATQVIIRFSIPEEASLRGLDVDLPSRITSPGTGRSGDVIVEVASLAVGEGVSIVVTCSTPLEQGWSREIRFMAIADKVDPTPEDDVLVTRLSVPFEPTVDSVRELTAPFRLELMGSHLGLRPFGSVAIGTCDAKLVAYEDTPDGTRLVLLGGKELRKLFPLRKAVLIQIVNADGGYNTITYTRSTPSN
jgi:hypothetical protein